MYSIASEHFVLMIQEVMKKVARNNKPVLVNDRKYGELVFLPASKYRAAQADRRRSNSHD